VKIGKIIIAVVAALLAAVIALVWVVLANINGIVKEVVVQAGQEVLQTQVSLNSVDIDVSTESVSGELQGFAVQNYPEFTQETLFSFDEITVEVDHSATTPELVVIDELTISGVQLVAEQKGSTTNLQVLLDKLNEGSSSESSSSSTDNSSEGAASEVRVAIKKLNFVNNSLRIATEKWDDVDVNMPSITRENLGDPAVGLTPAELAKEMIRPLIKEANSEVKDELKKALKEEVEEKYGDEIDKAKDKLKSLF